MKNLLFFAFVLSVSFCSCTKEEDVDYNISHLKDTILEIQDRKLSSSGSLTIFNAYTYGLKLNTDGTYDVFDDNYGNSHTWYNWKNSFDLSNNRWEKNGNLMIFTQSRSIEETIHWEIVDIKPNEITLKDVTGDAADKSVFVLFISAMQEEGK